MKGILGRKVGMTQVFTKDGKLIPVTIVSCDENVVMQVKTIEKDGYDSIQLGIVSKKESLAKKSEIGHAKKAKTTPKRFLKEIKGANDECKAGDVIGVDVFEKGDIVDVTGISKGHGTQGVIKRYNEARGPMGHGSHNHRRPGSMGTLRPMRVLKGKKLPGHMGGDTVTIQNLEIIEVNPTDNYILVSGNIPGAKNSYVCIKTSIKKADKKKEREIITYEDEKVVEEVKEEQQVEEKETSEVEEPTEKQEEKPIEDKTKEETEKKATEESQEEKPVENK